ncbi:hypothetical protein HYT32_02270 [Candidatus Roizmanbacteria bacterium]|nr:hypothetical protein [Candidatus Roizmanbacteria bacterium]
MREAIRRFMQRRAVDLGIYYILSGGDELTNVGKTNFKKMKNTIKKRENVNLSDYIEVLNGFHLSLDGLNPLEDLKGKGALYLGNHTAEGPIRNGNWKLFAISYYVKKITGKEIRWTYGQDKSTAQELYRKPVTESINAISVGERDGSQGVRDILKAFQNQDSVGLFPEGKSNKELIRGDPRAGGIVLHAAKKNIPIATIAAWFGENTCHLSFTLIDNDSIRIMGSGLSNKDESKQEIVDYVMRQIAQNLPPRLRGYYSENPSTNS